MLPRTGAARQLAALGAWPTSCPSTPANSASLFICATSWRVGLGAFGLVLGLIAWTGEFRAGCAATLPSGAKARLLATATADTARLRLNFERFMVATPVDSTPVSRNL